MYALPLVLARGRLETASAAVTRARVRRGAIEVSFLTCLYVVYSASRLLASNDFPAARGRASSVSSLEKGWRIALEHPLNDFFANNNLVGLFGSYWYATTHYIVTAGILLWLYHRGATHYVTARRALVVATIIGLSFYILLPTAPPRLFDGSYVDILSQHAQAGWWGADASAPRGLGGMTNELAAFPSLHAGWALWCAIALIRAGVRPLFQRLGVIYALITTIVIVGTANHWVIDALTGWIIVGLGWVLVLIWEKRSPSVAHEDLIARSQSTA